jgi:hypothetical protein
VIDLTDDDLAEQIEALAEPSPAVYHIEECTVPIFPSRQEAAPDARPDDAA